MVTISYTLVNIKPIDVLSLIPKFISYSNWCCVLEIAFGNLYSVKTRTNGFELKLR